MSKIINLIIFKKFSKNFRKIYFSRYTLKKAKNNKILTNESGGSMSINIGYIISPIDLTDRQDIIYKTMYKRCNFANMTVKYTLEQIANDIKIIKTNKDAVRRDIEKMIKQGYLKVIIKGSKGNPSTYEIAKIIDLNSRNMQPECNSKPCDDKALNDYNTTNVQEQYMTTAIPIKEKENYIYSEAIQKIIDLYPGRKSKDVRDKELPEIIKQYGEEKIIRCVKKYYNACKGKDKKYILNECTFWNGRYVEYLDKETEVEANRKYSKPNMIFVNL